MLRILTALAISFSLLLSPEAQVLLGNGVGYAGAFFYIVFVIVLGLGAMVLRCYSYAEGEEFTLLFKSFGPWLPLTSIFASRGVFFVTASTVVLVTAGYVFNEVFMNRFPNFGFAFLVLGMVLFLHLCSEKLARHIQVVFLLIWLVAMGYLVLHGLSAEEHLKAAGESVLSMEGLLLPFLLLIGVELSMVHPHRFSPKQALWVWFGLLGMFIFMMVWATIMTKMVSPELLSTSYIPHTKTASRLLGDPGRQALGLAMIVGTCGLVNGLLLVFRGQVREILRLSTLSVCLVESKWFASMFVIVVVASPAVMMARGMAGYDITEVVLRGSLLLWLGHYALMNVAVMGVGSSLFSWLHGGSALTFIGVAGGLLYIAQDSLALGQAIVFVVFVSGCISALVCYLCFRKRRPLLL